MESFRDHFQSLQSVDLFNSFVLAISSSGSVLSFEVELALMPGHPRFRDPGSDAFCYEHARVLIHGTASIDWLDLSISPTLDPDGTVDIGSFDSWAIRGDESQIDGDWGSVRVVDAKVDVVFD